MKQLSKAFRFERFNSIVSVSSSCELNLNGWLRLGVASVRGVSSVDCIWGSGVLEISLETYFD